MGKSEQTQQIPALPGQNSGSESPSSASTPEITQLAAPADSADVLADQQKRMQVMAELQKLGMSPEEVRRLLSANAHTYDPSETAAPKTPIQTSEPVPAAKAKQSARVAEKDLRAFAAQLMTEQAEQQNRAVQAAAEMLKLPEFRDSSMSEQNQATNLLREAHLLRKRERFTEAIEKCRQAVELTPKDAAALELMGDLYQGVAQTDSALACYQRAMQSDPKRYSAEKKYGDLLMRQEKWDVGDPEAVAPNAFAATLLSALLPGAGQFYTGQIAKGLVCVLLDVIFTYILGWSPYGFPSQHRGHGVNFSFFGLLLIVGAYYVWTIADAMVAAKHQRS